MWDLPGPGIEPVSPALAGGFLTTVPLGKSNILILEMRQLWLLEVNLSIASRVSVRGMSPSQICLIVEPK